MEDRYIAGTIGLLAGLFSIICAYKEYDWFMNHRKARFMCKVLGRNGARIFYMVLGGTIVIFALVALTVGFPVTP